MESPVRLCLGAAVVVHLLLLCSTTSRVSALSPQSTTTPTFKGDKVISPRYAKANGTTWVPRGRTRNADVALNELNSKDSVSEEHTDAKNAKYKDRGRVKFQSSAQSSTSTFTPRRLIKTSTETPKIVIVTPTPEQKNMSQIIDSMREYKKTKLPIVVSSTSPTPGRIDETVNDSSEEDQEEYEDDDDYKDKYNYDHHSPSGFHESNNFFTIPGFDDDEFPHDSDKENTVPKSYRVPSYDKFSSYFPKDISYSPSSEPYKSDNYFKDFDVHLTTPRNEFFDEKFKAISNSIMKNLASIRAQSPTPNVTNVHTIVNENGGVGKLLKGTPTNKSTVYIKNTKEIRVLDNDEAGTDRKELSDVHGTSIYYEMSVLSTETYAIDHSNEDDCDNDTFPYEPTPSTSSDEEIASIKATHENLISIPTKYFSSTASSISPISSTSTTPPPTTVQTFTQEPVTTTTESPTQKSYSSSYRSRTYSKRINLTNNRDYPNSVTVKTEHDTSNQAFKPVTRRIHYTTPKSKPFWMAPRRNITRHYTRTTYPTTIYAEHFNIKDSIGSKTRNKTSVLTTVSSDIDPILQSDIGGSKKVVHSQSISDNSIPQLRKRGSMKFTTSTATSAEVETESESDIMEIPPTLTAWALAGLRSPPSLISSPINNTGTLHKSIDENELQKVGEVTDKKSTTPSLMRPTISNNLNADFTEKKIFDVNQNKLPWKPLYVSSTESDSKTEVAPMENKSERLPAESNISIQSSVQPSTTETYEEQNSSGTENPPSISETTETIDWVHVNSTDAEELSTEEYIEYTDTDKPLPSTNNGTAFESITKLPSGITTPQAEDILTPLLTTMAETLELQTELTTVSPSTTPISDDFEITTIRFSYVPLLKDETTESSEPTATTDVWHPVTPEANKSTTMEDIPITTYRPKYITSTDVIEEATTIVPETTTQQDSKSNTESEHANPTTIAEAETESPTTIRETVTISESPVETKIPEVEPTTIIVEVVTEINTERETRKATTINVVQTTEEMTESSSNQNQYPIDSSSEENSGSNEVIMHVKETTARTTTSSDPITENVDEMTVIPMSNEKTEAPNVSQTETPKETTEKAKETTEHTTESLKEWTSISVEIHTSISESTTARDELTVESTTEAEGINYASEMTTEASSHVLNETSSGAAVAIAVSTIGVIALILLVGLLLVVRKRGRRGMYAQRCTPVSLDAYSLDSVSVGHRKGNQRLRASKRSYGNPAYDDEVTSHPMQYPALANFAMDIDSMTAEFSEIPSVSVRPDEVPLGCEDKNRYSNVLPLPETRVQLQRIGSDPATEYINANFITGPGNIKNYYVACQAPLPNTVVDFWRMIWEQNSRLIVMLTEYMENGVEKCYEYLPPSEISDNKRTFGDFQIILKKREQRDKYAISSVQLINLATRTWREVVHLWYFWPAKGVPDDYDSIIDFLSEMRSYMKISQTAKEYDEEGVEVIYGADSRSSFHNLSRLRGDDNGSTNGVNVYSPQKAEEQMKRSTVTNGTLGRMKAASEIEGVRPCVVVCASGSGRAAALVALDVCARALAAGAVDVPRVVREIRAQRPHSLANKHHYIFVYKVLSEYGNKLMGGGVDGI